jgi:hypothetical protein
MSELQNLLDAEARVKQLREERDAALRELARAGRLYASPAGLQTPEAQKIEWDYLEAIELVQRQAQGDRSSEQTTG